ncbi:MAG: alpha/beta hydrolase [Planctomycetales bacterium]|nr:alpha/beta hydrolase [Planctomycetales bacterium]
MNRYIQVILLFTIAIVSSPSFADGPGDQKLTELLGREAVVIPLWPGDGTRDDDPGADLKEELLERADDLVRITNVTRPTLHVWRPEKPDGRAVVIFPGGAYNILAAQHEGTEIAQWLNEQGITAFIAKYRVPRRKGLDKHAVALQDAQRAIRIVRARATEFGIDPKQIGVLGFSAGGNLAALTVHQSSAKTYEPIDDIDAVSAAPNFAVLIYPAYLVADGDNSKLDPLVAPLKSRDEYPSIFMAVASDDRFAVDSLQYVLQLQQQKVPAELHVYVSGGHGKGLRETGGPFAQWTHPCSRWLADLKQSTTESSKK